MEPDNTTDPVAVPVPVFVSVKLLFAEQSPTCTLPNSRETGVNSRYGAGASVPVPLTLTFCVVAPDEELDIELLAGPSTLGSNLTHNVVGFCITDCL